MRKLLPGVCLALALAGTLLARDFEIYFIDVEGGQATLMVSPSGESLLVDAGWPGFNHRDAERIAAAAKAAGVKEIGYLVITHYQPDHAGGVLQLAGKLPIRNFVDHGPTVETGRDALPLYNIYEEQRAKGNHILVKPGDTIPVKGLQVQVVSSAGAVLTMPLSGAGQPNPECAAFQKRTEDASENAQSIGLLVSYAGFRLLDLADLPWNQEFGLACPENKLGPVDLFIASSHGGEGANSPQLVHGLRPRVAVVENAARKGGAAETWQTLHDSPGMEDIWQLHYSVAAPKDRNSRDTYIANTLEICEAKWLRATVRKDGGFTMFNSRNKYEKEYPKR
jgi:competence protein ComEC